MMKRLRITFTKDEEIKYISHLDLIRAWERLLRRAGVPLAYSKGFNPHPKISVAAPLAVGITGDAELMDVTVEGDLTPEQFRKMIEPQMPAGLRIVEVVEAPLDAPTLQSRLSFAEYSIELHAPLSKDEIERRISAFMAAERIERQRRRPANKQQRGETRCYDLRSLVDGIWIENSESPTEMHLHLRLRVGPGGSADGSPGVGRPDEVMDALGLAEYAKSIRRTKLVVDSLP